MVHVVMHRSCICRVCSKSDEETQLRCFRICKVDIGANFLGGDICFFHDVGSVREVRGGRRVRGGRQVRGIREVLSVRPQHYNPITISHIVVFRADPLQPKMASLDF